MAVVQGKTGLVLELSGHILDSLTLAKVIDKIQLAGLEYHTNDLRIGQRKTDISTAQLSVWCQDPEVLSRLVAELEVYGVRVVGDSEVLTAPCTQPGEAPAGAYLRRNPPLQVRGPHGWIDVELLGLEFAIVVDESLSRARLVEVDDLQVSDRVVVGEQGLRVRPPEAAEA